MSETDNAPIERMLADLALALDMHDLLEVLHPDVKDPSEDAAEAKGSD